MLPFVRETAPYGFVIFFIAFVHQNATHVHSIEQEWIKESMPEPPPPVP